MFLFYGMIFSERSSTNRKSPPFIRLANRLIIAELAFSGAIAAHINLRNLSPSETLKSEDLRFIEKYNCGVAGGTGSYPSAVVSFKNKYFSRICF